MLKKPVIGQWVVVVDDGSVGYIVAADYSPHYARHKIEVKFPRSHISTIFANYELSDYEPTKLTEDDRFELKNLYIDLALDSNDPAWFEELVK